MDELKLSTEQLNISLNKTKDEVELLARSLDLKRIEFIEATTKQLEALDHRVKSIEKETVILHGLPKKLSMQISEIIPHIAIELNRLNQNEINNLKIALDNSIKEQNKAVNDAAARLNQIKEKIEKIDSGRIKRYCLGFGVVLIVSVLASLGATYAMIKRFPQRIQIESPGNVTVQGSEVSLWRSNNVNVTGNLEKKGR